MPVGPNGEMLPYQDEPSEEVEDVVRRLVREVEVAINADGQVSENERLLFEKLRTLAQQFLANREKENQAALGGGPATNALARMTSGF
jgi:hypothetical protein